MCIKLTWDQFKEEIISSSENAENCIYRGHASCNWELIPTLNRFLASFNGSKIEILANEYHKIIKDSFEYCDLPMDFSQEQAFRLSWMYPYDDHPQQTAMEQAVVAMIILRHFGFPTPILDWTLQPEIALFFALSENNDSKRAIFRLSEKICDSIDTILEPEKNFKILKHDFITDIFEKHTPEINNNWTNRHKKQKAAYTAALYNKQGNYYGNDPKMRQQPYFSFSPIEELLRNNKNFKLEKYVITDSIEKGNDMLKYLYSKGFSFESLYGETHHHENTKLKDIAMKKLLLKI